MQLVVALIAGLIFGFGLIIGGMANPAKVQNFLDIFGKWDISLALVMGGGLFVALIGYTVAKRWQHPLLESVFHAPTSTQIDKRLLVGASLFGIGWGIAGVCPAPAVVLASTGAWQGLLFVASMLVGMLVFKYTLVK